MQRLIGGALVLGCIIGAAALIDVNGLVNAFIAVGKNVVLAAIAGAGCFAGFRIMLADAQ